MRPASLVPAGAGPCLAAAYGTCGPTASVENSEPASPRPGWLRNGLARLLTVDTGMLGLDRSVGVHLTGFSVFIYLFEEQIQRDEGLD